MLHIHVHYVQESEGEESGNVSSNYMYIPPIFDLCYRFDEVIRLANRELTSRFSIGLLKVLSHGICARGLCHVIILNSSDSIQVCQLSLKINFRATPLFHARPE